MSKISVCAAVAVMAWSSVANPAVAGPVVPCGVEAILGIPESTLDGDGGISQRSASAPTSFGSASCLPSQPPIETDDIPTPEWPGPDGYCTYRSQINQWPTHPKPDVVLTYQTYSSCMAFNPFAGQPIMYPPWLPEPYPNIDMATEVYVWACPRVGPDSGCDMIDRVLQTQKKEYYGGITPPSVDGYEFPPFVVWKQWDQEIHRNNPPILCNDCDETQAEIRVGVTYTFKIHKDKELVVQGVNDGFESCSNGFVSGNQRVYMCWENLYYCSDTWTISEEKCPGPPLQELSDAKPPKPEPPESQYCVRDPEVIGTPASGC